MRTASNATGQQPAFTHVSLAASMSTEDPAQSFDELAQRLEAGTGLESFELSDLIDVFYWHFQIAADTHTELDTVVQCLVLSLHSEVVQSQWTRGDGSKQISRLLTHAQRLILSSPETCEFSSSKFFLLLLLLDALTLPFRDQRVFGTLTRSPSFFSPAVSLLDYVEHPDERISLAAVSVLVVSNDASIKEALQLGEAKYISHLQTFSSRLVSILNRNDSPNITECTPFVASVFSLFPDGSFFYKSDLRVLEEIFLRELQDSSDSTTRLSILECLVSLLQFSRKRGTLSHAKRWFEMLQLLFADAERSPDLAQCAEHILVEFADKLD